MGRKRSDFWAVIHAIHERSPIWVGPLLATGFFILGFWVIPAMLPGLGPGKVDFGVLLKPVAKVAGVAFAGLILVDWVVVASRKGSARRMFDRKSPAAALSTMSWSQFEYYVAEAFRRKGYGVERTGNPAGDGGIDVILRKDGMVTLVQCKHWKAWKVGVQPVRELLGVVSSQGAKAGALVTSGRFTREAFEFAEANRIWLIDGQELRSIIASLQALPAAAQPAVAVSPFPEISNATPIASSPVCPQCKSPMILRTARRGDKVGSQFWGCSRFPKCRGARQV